MKTIALIDTSLPINTRNQKIIDSLLEHDPSFDIHVITWARQKDDKIELDNYHVYQKESPLGKPLQKLMHLWGFKQYLQNELKQLQPDVIIASHWDTLILVPKLRKEQKLIYENLDVPTGPWFIRYPIRVLERIALQHTTLIIHASRFFQQLYPQHIPQIVLENKPHFEKLTPEYNRNARLRIAFIGTIRYFEIFKNAIDAVRGDKDVELYFHGTGPDINIGKKYAHGEPNVYFTGGYRYNDIIPLYLSADVIWAAYPNKDYNVKYAISNKFHESILLGIPCVYANNTYLGDFVSQQGIGLVVNPYDQQDIKKLITDIKQGKINLQQIRKNMQTHAMRETTWNDDFDKVMKYINKEYE